MEVAAKLRGAKMSAQKARLVVDQIRGKEVGDALNILNFSTKKGAHLVRKLLESAIANAEHNEAADVDELKVSTAFVDEGLTMKRIRPRAMASPCRLFSKIDKRRYTKDHCTVFACHLRRNDIRRIML